MRKTKAQKKEEQQSKLLQANKNALESATHTLRGLMQDGAIVGRCGQNIVLFSDKVDEDIVSVLMNVRFEVNDEDGWGVMNAFTSMRRNEAFVFVESRLDDFLEDSDLSRWSCAKDLADFIGRELPEVDESTAFALKTIDADLQAHFHKIFKEHGEEIWKAIFNRE